MAISLIMMANRKCGMWSQYPPEFRAELYCTFVQTGGCDRAVLNWSLMTFLTNSRELSNMEAKILQTLFMDNHDTFLDLHPQFTTEYNCILLFLMTTRENVHEPIPS